jgi:hypothetical protein
MMRSHQRAEGARLGCLLPLAPDTPFGGGIGLANGPLSRRSGAFAQASTRAVLHSGRSLPSGRLSDAALSELGLGVSERRDLITAGRQTRHGAACITHVRHWRVYRS